MFRFNPKKYSFFNLYDSIKQYYPIGIDRQDSEIYLAYPGIKKLSDIVVDNIHMKNGLNPIWENLIARVTHETQCGLRNTTYGQAPCYSSFISMHQSVHDDFTRIKEIHFFVSLVGPYYSIIGIDRNEIPAGERTIRSDNFLVVSPENEYAENFILIKKLIEGLFNGYRFVPFAIAKQYIEGLGVRYADNSSNSIFNALFNQQINMGVQTVGSEVYQIETWIHEGYVDDGSRWTSYPPNYNVTEE